MKNTLELAGKKFYKEETGYIHFMYHQAGLSHHYTIPVFENLCWSLANFMLKTKEGVEEGKRLLTHLLAFQTETGEFPVYLHDYPTVKDAFLGAYLFHPLFLIKKEFHHVMGKELLEKLEKSLERLTQALLKQFQEKNPQGHIRIKVGAALMAMGMPEGEAILSDPPELVPSSFHIADRELARDLGAVKLPLWPKIFWHPTLKAYVGPAHKERQEGDQPEVTLLDLMMGAEHKERLTPHHLCMALVRSSPLPEEVKTRGVRVEESFGFAALDQKEGEMPTHPGYHLFRLVTEGEGKLDTLAIPGGNYKKVSFKETDQGVVFEFHLPAEFDPDSRDKSREIAVYFNLGVKYDGSVFRLNEPIDIQFKHIRASLEFRLKAGSGDFIGQRARGNRPSQLLKEGVYDEVLFLRSLRRSEDAVIELEIKVT
ncbi:MAG: hypothetical protein KDK62_06940 [Chlamydiia bacterium]|nr:hypothetical protein [Chlamydiia bacterium]